MKCSRCDKEVDCTSAIDVQSGARYNVCDDCLEAFFLMMSGASVGAATITQMELRGLSFNDAVEMVKRGNLNWDMHRAGWTDGYTGGYLDMDDIMANDWICNSHAPIDCDSTYDIRNSDFITRKETAE